jgi:alkyldihydroxyacetonephosphate synthase
VDEIGARPASPAGRDLAWAGWGPPGPRRPLPPGTLEVLRAELGELEPAPAAPAAELPPARPVLGLDGVVELRVDDASRLRCAAGRSYPDLVRLRSGAPGRAPDAVAVPASAAEVRALLRAAAAEGVAVVPFGGGTSVVGGVDPLAGPHGAVVALDLGRLDRLVALDDRSGIAVLEAGLRLPEAEALLRARGLTLGHVPQSYEYATVGGCVATRSAGQASTGYGRIDELVVGLDAAAPAGDLSFPPRPPSAAGPDLVQLVVGSEGALAVICSVALRVRPAPARSRAEGWSFPSWEAGLEAFRMLVRSGRTPDIARLSDPEETRLTFAQAGDGAGVKALLGYRRLRGHAHGCLAILGWDGDEDIVPRRGGGAEILEDHGAIPLGSGPGRAWQHGRFAAPYLRDSLLDAGVMAETLETAATWSEIEGVHAAVGAALRGALADRGTPPVVGCHVSHLYAEGASLYFTFLARRETGAELEQWAAAKRAATDAIVAAGGTITHHHAVGVDHAPWLPAEVGETGVAVLRAAKRELDPAGILNPGKLLGAEATVTAGAGGDRLPGSV